MLFFKKVEPRALDPRTSSVGRIQTWAYPKASCLGPGFPAPCHARLILLVQIVPVHQGFF